MITLNDLTTMKEADRNTYRNYRISTRKSMEALETAYSENELDTIIPAYVAAVGYSEAVRTIASLVNESSYDGRIDGDVKTWAASIDTAADRQAANELNMCTSIHKAHLNQIARAMMEYEPETETEETETEETETVEGPRTWKEIIKMKIDKHGLNITGLKKCSGNTRNYSERSACYNEIFYDKADGEVWADFHCSIGGNEWTEYRSKNVIRICSTAEHLTMQQIADMIRDKLDEIDHIEDCAAW